MTNKVFLSDATFYDVDEVHIDNDPERGSGVYIKLIRYNKDENQFLPGTAKEPRRHMALSCSRMTCFRWQTEDPPLVFVDGKKIEPNPAEPEPELVGEDE